jgi:hypothetical protein
MPSITTWQRLEPLPRTDDLRIGLRAETADRCGSWRGSGSSASCAVRTPDRR